MTNAPDPADPQRRRLAEAAAWRVHLAETGADTNAEFEAWLADDGNRAAWARVEAPWDYFAEQATAPELIAARRAALGDARSAQQQRGRASGWSRRLAALAATVVAAALLWGGVMWLGGPADYRTALGERRVVTLADGSRVSLDSDSEVLVRYTKQARELELRHGQARFDVAHDVERPFWVRARDQKIIATGTAFTVDIAGPTVLVTLIEGHVLVLKETAALPILAPQPPAPIELHAGEQLAAPSAAPPKVARVSLEKATAWQNGQLMFDNEPLSSVVARVNRYSGTPIVITDPRVAELRISGVFNEGDVRGFVDTITHYLPLAADADNGRILVRPKS